MSQKSADTAPTIAKEAFVFAHEASDIPPDPRVKYGVLDNGMRYAIVENDTPKEKVALRLIFNAGTLAEAEDQQEVAHFLEHMNFNGTTNVPEGEMIPLLERVGLAFGPDTNAFTGPEVTGYELALPSNSEEIVNIGLFLMRETASEIVFDQGAIDREEGIIMSEGRARNTPIRRFFDAYNAFLYPNTSVARPAYPSDEYVQALEADKFQRFYDDFYVPERAMLVVVGDIDPSVIEQKIKQGFDVSIPGLDVSFVESFANWEQPEDSPEPYYGEFTVPSEPKFGVLIDPEIFTIINVSYKSPGQKKADTKEVRREQLLLQLAHAILQRRISSDINAGTSPLIQYNPSYGNSFDQINSASVLAVADPSRWQEGVAVVEQSIRQAIEFGFYPSELNEQLANTRTALEDAAAQMDTTDSDSLASAIFQSWLEKTVFVSPEYALQWFDEIEQTLTVEAVEDAFRKVWTLDTPSIFLTNSVEIDGGVETLQAVWEASQSQEVVAVEDVGEVTFAYTDFGAASEIVSMDVIDDFNYTQLVFANGVTLNVKSTDFEDEVIHVRADFGAGNLTPQTTPAVGAITSNTFVTGGLEAHNYDELQRALVGTSTFVNLTVQDDSFALIGATTPDDIALQLQLMTAFIEAPGFREESLTRYRAIASELRRQQSSNTVSTVVNTVFRTLRGGDERWGFPTVDEVDTFTLQAAEIFLRPALAEAPIEITIVGDITVEKATALVSKTFGALSQRNSEFPTYIENALVDLVATGQATQTVSFNGQPNQSMANTFYQTTGGKTAKERRVLQLLASVLRLKAIEILREELGATYSPIVSSQTSSVFEAFGFMWMGVDVTPETLDAAYATTADIVSSVKNGDVTDDDLQRAVAPLLERLEQDAQDNQVWLSRLAKTQRNPWRLENLRTLVDDYKSITVEELVTAANTYLTEERAYRVTVEAAQK
ncbi:MAG: insulinase family protein [Pseudomonadota bacterium]